MSAKIRSSIQAQVLALVEALAQLPDPQSRRFAEILKQGHLSVERFSPYEAESQPPYTRDAAYMVVQGSGIFVCGDKRIAFEAGHFLFTPAGTLHRFERLSEDAVIWIISDAESTQESSWIA
jgi:mannose-6-phosphate isomerase-like protein (cupin superfamily)